MCGGTNGAVSSCSDATKTMDVGGGCVKCRICSEEEGSLGAEAWCWPFEALEKSMVRVVVGLAIVVISVEEQGRSVQEVHQSNVPQSTTGSPEVVVFGAEKRIMIATAN